MADSAAQRSFLRSVGVAALAGLGGFPAALLIVAAVIAGRRLDAALGTAPGFVLGLTCLAIPLGVVLMIGLAWLAVRAARRLNQQDYALLTHQGRPRAALADDDEEDRSE